MLEYGKEKSVGKLKKNLKFVKMEQLINSSRTMEPETISKTGANSKNWMNKKYFFKYFGIIALAVAITVIVSSFDTTSQQTERWEYQVVCTCDDAHLVATERKLNSLGREGWELVTVVSWNLNLPDDLVFTLKRRVR